MLNADFKGLKPKILYYFRFCWTRKRVPNCYECCSCCCCMGLLLLSGFQIQFPKFTVWEKYQKKNQGGFFDSRRTHCGHKKAVLSQR